MDYDLHSEVCYISRQRQNNCYPMTKNDDEGMIEYGKTASLSLLDLSSVIVNRFVAIAQLRNER